MSRITVSIREQTLDFVSADGNSLHYSVSTATNGVGEKFGSECTPKGHHLVRAKIGDNCPMNTVFVARRPSGEIYSSQLGEAEPERDWILTRILWLSGLEPGVNRLGEVDTLRRYIYIHGVPDESPMGVPASHGCVRMRNRDIVELFDAADIGTQVYIEE